MSVNSYLANTASQIIITNNERVAIDANITSLSGKLTAYFNQGQIKERLAFGSYTRKTLMPRKADSRSDVDYMVVFDTSSYTYTPETYLKWLRDFATAKYATSEIYPSHPTVVLELSKIKIELVPAIKTVYGDDYQIPAPASHYSKWLTTHPNTFNSQVSSKNTAEKSLIRPMIRLMKYWNAKNDYPYSSYELEQLIVNQFYYSCNNVWDYIYMFVSNLNTYNLSTTAANKVTRLKKICTDAKTLETSGYVSAAESKIVEAFPVY